MIFDLRAKKGAAPAVVPERESTVSQAEEAPGNVSQITLEQLVSLLHLGDVPHSRLGEATYFACLRMLSEGLGRLPLKLMRTTEEQGVEECRDMALYHTLRYRPNPFMTATRFWGTMENWRNHYGNSYAWIQPYGDTVRLWQLESNRVSIWWDNKKLLSDTEHIWYIYHAPNGKQYPLCDEEVLHFRTWLSLDGITGLAVQDILKMSLDGAAKSQAMLNQLYDNGFTAKAVVQYTGDLNDKLEQQFIQNIENYAAGRVDGSKHIIPIPIGHKLEPLDIKLADGQFLELRKYTALQVAAAFGIKPDQINDYTKSSYSSSEAQQLAFLVDTQLYILKDYEEEIAYKLLTDEQRREGRIYPKFNTAVALRADTKTQIETLAKAVSNEIYTPDEARAFLDMGKKPGGDQLYANGNLIPLTRAGQQYGGKGGSE